MAKPKTICFVFTAKKVTFHGKKADAKATSEEINIKALKKKVKNAKTMNSITSVEINIRNKTQAANHRVFLLF